MELLIFGADGAGVPRLEDGAADGAFLARPSLLICSEILIGILSPPGVTSRELDDGSFLIVAEAEAFFDVGVDVALEEDAARGVNVVEPDAIEVDPASSAPPLAAFSFFSESILSARM